MPDVLRSVGLESLDTFQNDAEPSKSAGLAALNAFENEPSPGLSTLAELNSFQSDIPETLSPRFRVATANERGNRDDFQQVIPEPDQSLNDSLMNALQGDDMVMRSVARRMIKESADESSGRARVKRTNEALDRRLKETSAEIGARLSGGKDAKEADVLAKLNANRESFGFAAIDELPGKEGTIAALARQFGTAKGLEAKLPFESSLLLNTVGIPAKSPVLRLLLAKQAIQKKGEGKTLTLDERESLVGLQEDIVRSLRGGDFGSGVVNIVSESLPFMAEFIASGAVVGSAKAGAKKVIASSVRRSLVRRAAGAVGELALASARIAGQTALRLPFFSHRVAAGTIQRMLPEFSGVAGDGGEFEIVVGDPGDPVGKALANAGLDTFIEIFSEQTGGVVGRVVGPVKRRLGIKPLRVGVQKWLDAAAFNGVAGEMTEERIGEVLRLTATTLGGDLIDIAQPPPTLEQLGQEAVSFAVPGVAARVSSSLADRLLRDHPQTAQAIADKHEAGEPITRSDLKGTGVTVPADQREEIANELSERGKPEPVAVETQNAEDSTAKPKTEPAIAESENAAPGSFKKFLQAKGIESIRISDDRFPALKSEFDVLQESKAETEKATEPPAKEDRPDYESQTTKDLRGTLKSRGVPGSGSIKRSVLIQRLQDHDLAVRSVNASDAQDLNKMGMFGLRQLAKQLGVSGGELGKVPLVSKIIETARTGVAPSREIRTRKGLKEAEDKLLALADDLFGAANDAPDHQGFSFNDTREGRSLAGEIRDRLPDRLRRKVTIKKGITSGVDSQDTISEFDGGVDEAVDLVLQSDAGMNRQNRIEEIIRKVEMNPDQFGSETIYEIQKLRQIQSGPEGAAQAKGTSPEVIDASSLNTGDTVEIAGEEFSVRDVNNSTVTLEDGTTLQVPTKLGVAIDKGSLEKSEIGSSQLPRGIPTKQQWERQPEFIPARMRSVSIDEAISRARREIKGATTPIDRMFAGKSLKDAERAKSSGVKRFKEPAGEKPFGYDSGTRNGVEGYFRKPFKAMVREAKRIGLPDAPTGIFGQKTFDAATGKQSEIAFETESKLIEQTKRGRSKAVEAQGQTTLDPNESDASFRIDEDDDLAEPTSGDVPFSVVPPTTPADSRQREKIRVGNPTRPPGDPASEGTVGHVPTPMRVEAPSGERIKPTSAPRVMAALAGVIKAFEGKVPIRSGRVKGKRRLGFFEVQPEVIRIKTANDIPTATHEVGHAIEKLVFGWKRSGPWKKPRVGVAIQNELVRLGKELYGATKPVGGYKREGFAEFIRYYVTDRTTAKKKAPQFFSWFEGQFLKENPAGAEAIEVAAAQAKRFQDQGAVERGRQGILDSGSIRERARRFAKTARKAVSITTHVDMLQPIVLFTREAERKLGRTLDPGRSPEALSQGLRLTHDARVEQMVENGMIDPAGNRVGPSLKEAVAPVRGQHRDFTVYLWARRARALWLDPKKPAGRNPGLSLEDAEQIIKELETPKFQLAARGVYDWNDGVLNYAAGFSEAFATVVDAIRKVDPGFYIPLAREFERLDGIWASNGGSVKQGKISGFLSGSGRRIKDPIPQMIANASNVVRAAHNRKIIEEIVRLAENVEGLGHLVDRVSKDRVPVASRTISQLVEDINKRLFAAGAEPTLTIEGEDVDLVAVGEELITFFMPAQQPKQGETPVVPIKRDGQIVWYEIDPDLFRSLGGMDVFRFTGGARILEWVLAKPARVFRAGTTGLRASFGLVTNPLRDLPTMYINSQANANGAQMFFSWAQSIAEAFKFWGKTPELTDTFLRLGGRMAQPFAQDVDRTRTASRKLFQGRTVKALDPRNWFDWYRDLVQIPESAPRIAEFRQVAKDIGWEPGTPMSLDQSLQLILAAKQVTTDFSAAGEFSRAMNQIVPFFNAAIQGPRASLRAARRNPGKFAMRSLLSMTIPTLLLWWKVRDEEWYKELDANQRFLFWHIPLDWPEKTLIKIPRPFEVGMLFSAMPEAFIDSWYREDPDTAKAWFDTFLNVTVPDPRPVLVREGMQQFRNWDDFWDRPVVSRRLEVRPEEEQFDEWTSSAAIAIGDVFNVSPKRIDHAIRGIGGGVSADVVSVLGLGPKGVDRERQAADIPVLGRLFSRGRFGARTRSVNKMYDLLESAQKRQHSDSNPETKPGRRERLMLTDAARAVSNLLYVRSQAPKTSQREALTERAMGIARDVVGRIERGEVDRGDFSFAKKVTGFERVLARAETDVDRKAVRDKFILTLADAASDPIPIKRRNGETVEQLAARKHAFRNLTRRNFEELRKMEITPDRAVKLLKTRYKSGTTAFGNRAGRLLKGMKVRAK